MHMPQCHLHYYSMLHANCGTPSTSNEIDVTQIILTWWYRLHSTVCCCHENYTRRRQRCYCWNHDEIRIASEHRNMQAILDNSWIGYAVLIDSRSTQRCLLCQVCGTRLWSRHWPAGANAQDTTITNTWSPGSTILMIAASMEYVECHCGCSQVCTANIKRELRCDLKKHAYLQRKWCERLLRHYLLCVNVNQWSPPSSFFLFPP